MLIEYYGHSQFLLTGNHGEKVLTDPYDASVGYPVKEICADVVTITHGHGDHSDLSKVKGHPIVIREQGTFSPMPDVSVEAFPCWHDDQKGTLRGSNLMMKITMDGISVLHAGDLGHIPDEVLLKNLGHVDILLLPVGGFFTVDGKTAAKIASMIQPKVTIPMHFKTSVNANWPISTEESFMDEMSATAQQREEMPLLRVEKGDLSQQPAVVRLKIR